jgi:hypothetical protein
VTAGFCRDADEICAILWYYAAQSGNTVPGFQDREVEPKIRYGISWLSCVISQRSADLIMICVQRIRDIASGYWLCHSLDDRDLIPDSDRDFSLYYGEHQPHI